MTGTVTFYLPELEDARSFEDVDPDIDWHLLGTGRFQTVGQTYLRLRQRGLPVSLATDAAVAGVVVVFAPNLQQFLAECPSRADVTLVCVQADRPVRQLPLADVIVRHNGHRVDNRRFFFIPNWPQGGIRPRADSRGARIERIVYKGRLENLHPDFLGTDWTEFCERRGISFEADTEGELQGNHTYERGAMSWNDYTDADLVIAVRPSISDPYARKPAVKLVNAWFAGVPALLGPEFAFQELRRSPLDFVEVDSVAAAQRAVDELLEDRDRYLAMIENGHARSAEFTVEAILRQWEWLLFDRLREWRPHPIAKAARPALAPFRRLSGRLHHARMRRADPYRQTSVSSGPRP